MTANELIETLKHFDKNMEVCIGVYSQPSIIEEVAEEDVYNYEKNYSYMENCIYNNKKRVVLITPIDTE